MGEQELFTLGVAIAVVVIIGRAVATRLEVPEAIALVVLGVLASLIPQVPNIDLPPDLVLLLFVPPLIYNAAFFTAPRETRENAVPITALAVGTTAAEVAAVIAIRMAWELGVSPLIRFLPGRHPAFMLNPWRQRLVIGWGGMRGAVSLAIALTLPETIDGRPFGQRSTLVLLAAVGVVVTLIGEGLTLAPLLRALGLAQGNQQRRVEATARARVTEAGLARLDGVRAVLDDNGTGTGTDGAAEPGGHGVRAELISAQRAKLDELYRNGKISDEVRRTISRTLDLQEPRSLH